MGDLSKLFWSKCRTKILEKFLLEKATQGEGKFFIRELCREIDEQINSVRRELMNLEKLSILRSYSHNKKKIYSLNNHCSFLPELSEIFLKNFDSIGALKGFFKGNKKIDLLVLSESLKNPIPPVSNNIVDIFIIGEIDKIAFNMFLAKTFFSRKVKFANLSKENFYHRLEYGDKLVLNILKQPGNIFVKDKLLIQEKIEEMSEG